MSWKLHCLWPLTVAVSLTEASSAIIDVVETVQYEYIFEQNGGYINGGYILENLDFTGIDAHGDNQFSWNIREYPAEYDAYAPYLAFKFWHYSNKILDLSGQNFNLVDLLLSHRGPIEGAGYNWLGESSSYAAPSGYIEFGPGNVITSWRFDTHVPSHGEGRGRWSDPRYLIGSGWFVEDIGVFDGRAVYGYNYSESGSVSHWTNPGRWTTSVYKLCHLAEDGSQAPCPEPVPPLNGCGPSDGAPPKCDTIALVPLPPSLLLLLSGLAGVGMLRGHRTWGWLAKRNPA